MELRDWKVLLPISAVLLLLTEAQKIPDLPNFFSGYVETVLRVGEAAPSLKLTREFFDLNSNLTRTDLASQAVYPDVSVEGTISIVQDLQLKLQYFINRKYRNCTVRSLPTHGNVYIDSAWSVHTLDSNHLFYLVNVSQFAYAGNSASKDGIVTDNWIFTGNFSQNGMAFVNTTIRLSITQTGWSVPTISSVSSNPILWNVSVDGVVVMMNGSFHKFSTVSKFYDLSFEPPDYDVFDVSYCAPPTDSIRLSLAVPMESDVVDYSNYQKSLRQAIANYTQVYPNQIGQIEVSSNGTALLTTLLLCNISSKANVTNRKTAASAYEMIVDNSVDGFAPFQVETAPGTDSAPQVLVAEVASENCSSLDPTESATAEPPTTVSSDTSDPVSPTPCPTMSCSCSLPKTLTVTVPASSPCHGPVVPSLPVVTTTEVLQPSATIEISSCPAPSPSVCPSPSAISNYTKGGVVGLSFGMVFLGVFLTLASLFMGFLVYNHCILRHTDRSRTGYHKHIDSKPNNAYFQ